MDFVDIDSKTYNMSVTALEEKLKLAKHNGTSVVTTDCGGNRDYARNGENCLLVPPSDIDQLSAAIYHLLTQDVERQRLASSGHLFAQAWTWQRTADQVEAFLLSL